MERNQLRYVVETARYGNITKAAEALHIAQPSLSAQIIQLEKELGIPLFERTRKRVYLTEAGEAFVYQAEQILNSMNSLKDTMNEYAQEKRGSLKLGLLPIMAPIGLVDMLAEFREEFPDFDLSVAEAGSRALIEKTKQNETDASIVIMQDESGAEGMHAVFLKESLFVAAVPADHPLAERKELYTEDFRDEKLVLPQGTFNLQNLILDLLNAKGIPYHLLASCSQTETCFALASHRFGITFCSMEMAEHCPYDNLKFIPVGDVPQRKIWLVYKKTPEYHPALNEFIQFVRDYYGIGDSTD